MFRPLRYLLDLFFPPLCPCCRKPIDSESELICRSCTSTIRLTEHVVKQGNMVEQMFDDIPKVVRAASFAYYTDESALRRAIHALKYGGRPQLGAWLGQWAASEMKRQNEEWFDKVDAIVPVPLHPKKQRKRGYNQSYEIALGVAQVIAKPVIDDAISKVVDNPTQTHMTIEQRKQNSQGVFLLNNLRATELRGKHLLLIDDVVTTGSTLRDCIRCLTPLRGTTIQVMTLAVPANNLRSSTLNT